MLRCEISQPVSHQVDIKKPTAPARIAALWGEVQDYCEEQGSANRPGIRAVTTGEYGLEDRCEMEISIPTGIELDKLKIYLTEIEEKEDRTGLIFLEPNAEEAKP